MLPAEDLVEHGMEETHDNQLVGEWTALTRNTDLLTDVLDVQKRCTLLYDVQSCLDNCVRDDDSLPLS